MNHVTLVQVTVVHVYHPIVGMGRVTVMNRVATVLKIVVNVIHVAMDTVSLESPMETVLKIVPLFVAMEYVKAQSHVKRVTAIVRRALY